MVFMNADGQGDIFKARSILDCEETLTPGLSPALAAPVPKLILPKALMEFFNKEKKKSGSKGSSHLKPCRLISSSQEGLLHWQPQYQS